MYIVTWLFHRYQLLHITFWELNVDHIMISWLHSSVLGITMCNFDISHVWKYFTIMTHNHSVTMLLIILKVLVYYTTNFKFIRNVVNPLSVSVDCNEIKQKYLFFYLYERNGLWPTKALIVILACINTTITFLQKNNSVAEILIQLLNVFELYNDYSCKFNRYPDVLMEKQLVRHWVKHVLNLKIRITLTKPFVTQVF